MKIKNAKVNFTSWFNSRLGHHWLDGLKFIVSMKCWISYYWISYYYFVLIPTIFLDVKDVCGWFNKYFFSFSLEICTPSTPFIMLSDLFDSTTLDKCSDIFKFVEDRVNTWKSVRMFHFTLHHEFFYHGKCQSLSICPSGASGRSYFVLKNFWIKMHYSHS